MHSLIHQLKASLRGLLRTPSFTAVALLTLALAIGANTAIFSVVKVVFLRPLPFREPERLALLYTADLEKRFPDIRHIPASVPRYLDWKSRQQVFADVAAMRGALVNLTGDGEPARLTAMVVTGNFFPMLGLRPLLGRPLGPQDEQGAEVAVLSHGFWKRRYGGDPGIVGRSILLNGQGVAVVGVLPAEVTLEGEPDLLVPMTLTPQQTQGPRGNNSLTVWARLKPGVSFAQARQALAGLGCQLQQEYAADKGWSVDAVPLWDALYGEQRPLLGMLLLAGGLILAIACANVANLMLSRAAGRQRETALRMALGGSRLQCLAPFLADALIVSLAGACLGLGIALLGSGALRPLVPEELLGAYRLDLGGLAYTLAVSLAAALACGLAPALLFPTRALSLQIQEGAKGSEGRRRRWLRGTLVAVQVALALSLSVGFGAVWASLQKLRKAPIGFQTENGLTFTLRLNPRKYPESAARERVVKGIAEALSALPGVRSVGTTNLLPIADGGWNGGLTIPGREQEKTIAHFRTASPRYFETMGIRLLRGRNFAPADYTEAPNAVVVSQSFAERYWPGEDPIGKQFLEGLAEGDTRSTIVGVVSDVRLRGPAFTTFLETVYWPFYHHTFAASARFVVRSTGASPAALAPGIRELVRRADPDIPVARLRSLGDVVEAQTAGVRSQAGLLGLMAGVALTLAGSGIFGVMAYSVSQRGREIGIRMALGGKPQRVARDIARQGMLLAALGLGLGVMASVALGRFLASQLYEVSPVDPLIMALAAAVLGAVALLSSLVPAARAARLDPIRALRDE